MKYKNNKKNLSKVVSSLINIQEKIEKLPVKLPEVEKAKIEQNVAIEQLYNSSRLEGSRLNDKRIDKAIFGYGA